MLYCGITLGGSLSVQQGSDIMISQFLLLVLVSIKRLVLLHNDIETCIM